MHSFICIALCRVSREIYLYIKYILWFFHILEKCSGKIQINYPGEYLGKSLSIGEPASVMNALSCRTVSLWCKDDTQSWGGDTRITAAGWLRLLRWLDIHSRPLLSLFRHQTRNLITFCQIQCCIIVFSWSEYLIEKSYFRRPVPWRGIWNSKISILVPANVDTVQVSQTVFCIIHGF